MNEFQKRIHDFRMDTGLTERQCAVLLGVGHKTLVNWFTYRIVPYESHLLRIRACIRFVEHGPYRLDSFRGMDTESLQRVSKECTRLHKAQCRSGARANFK